MAGDAEARDAWGDHVAQLLRGFAITGAEIEAPHAFMTRWPHLSEQQRTEWREAARTYAGVVARHALAEQRTRLRVTLTAEVQRAAAVLRDPATKIPGRTRIDAVCAAHVLRTVQRVADALGVELDDIIWQSAAPVQPVLRVMAPSDASGGGGDVVG